MSGTAPDHSEELLDVLRQLMQRNRALDIKVRTTAIAPIDETELAAIRFVGERGSVRMKALTEHLKLPSSSATYLADRMIEKGLVRRDANPADRRIVLLSLDTAGKQIYADALDAQMSLCREMLDSFSEGERDAVVKLLGKFLTSKEADDEDPKRAAC